MYTAQGGAQRIVCNAHVEEVSYGAASCSTFLELGVGDQFWVVGHGARAAHVVPEPFSSFHSCLLYRSDTSNRN